MSNILDGIGKMMNKLMLSCGEATMLITRSEFEELSSIKQFKLKMHLASCSMCRNFKKQSSIITSQVTELKKELDANKMRVALSDDSKKNLQDLINKNLQK